MDESCDESPTSIPANRKGSKLPFHLNHVVRNIFNSNNDAKKTTVKEGVLNSEIVDRVSPQNPRNNCMETPRRTKRRRESERTDLEYGDVDPHFGSSDSSDPTWENSCAKKPRKITFGTEQLTFPQDRKFTSSPVSNGGANKIISTKITTEFRSNVGATMVEKPFKCDYCDYRTTWGNALRSHVRTHTGEKPYKCCQCDYRAIQKSNLQSHEKIHTGEKPYKCELCDYRANRRATLQEHERIHTGEKPYKCGNCDYRAIKKSKVQRHEKIHTGEKPYKCEHCDYRASQRAHLQKHERVHTGEKPYKCGHCDYRANQKAHLQVHERTHTGEKAYKCSQCDYRASQSSNLRRHERVHTGERQCQ